MKKLWWCLVCVLALGVTSACDNGDGDTDAGTADSGGGDVDSGPSGDPVVLATEQSDPLMQGAADYSCRGTVTAPAGGDTVTFPLVVENFGAGGTVADLMVHFFPDNVVSADGTCTGSCQVVTTDASGMASVMAPEGGWYAYRIPGQTATAGGTPSEFVPVVQINEVAPPAGEDAAARAVGAALQNTFIGLLGFAREAGTAVITGTVVDCMGRPVANARVRVFDADGQIELSFASSGAPREFYFNGNFESPLPAARAQATAADGLYGTANLPVPANGLIRVETWGVVEEGGEPEMLGCERVLVNADGITIVNVGGTRSDGPSDCSG